MNKQSWSGRQGFTLIELMVAMVVLTIGLFAIIHLQVVAVRGNSYARERTEAYQMALAIEEEMRQRGLEWVDNKSGPDPAFADVFADIVLSPNPLPGQPIDVAELHSLTSFNGFTTAPDTNPTSALAVNLYGRSPSTDADLFGARAIYRLHYTAHQVEAIPGRGPSPDLVRLTVFVSWDNKDHGRQDTDWEGAWFDEFTFFDRHMVTATFYLSRLRHW